MLRNNDHREKVQVGSRQKGSMERRQGDGGSLKKIHIVLMLCTMLLTHPIYVLELYKN